MIALELIDTFNRARKQCSEVVELQNYQSSSESFRLFTLFRQKNHKGEKLPATCFSQHLAQKILELNQQKSNG